MRRKQTLTDGNKKPDGRGGNAGNLPWACGVAGTASGKQRKTPSAFADGVLNKSLAVSYFHVEEPHTIIGAEQFHFRVRDGIGWFPLAMAARQTFYAVAISRHSLCSGSFCM